MSGVAVAAKVELRDEPYAVRPPAVGSGTLRRLARLAPEGGPVLSAYLALEPDAVESCDAELVRLAGRPLAPERLATIGRVRDALRSMPSFAHGTRGLALFLAARGSEVETVPLPEAVATIVVLDAQPWLEPLADMAQPGRRGAPSPRPAAHAAAQ